MNKPRAYLFDPKCLEVAEHFLPADASEQLKNELAQSVQNAVEEFCEMGSRGFEPEGLASNYQQISGMSALLTCTCPRSTNSRDEPVRYTDQLCPVHGAKAQQLPHCATCTCGVGSPIVQVPKVEKPHG